MERYAPLFTITIAFTVAIWSYVYYSDYHYVNAENRIKAEQMQNEQQERVVVKVEAKHILVKSLEAAEKIRNEIIQGEEFEKLAQKNSLCPSGKFGGDLGCIKKGQMVKEFENAVFSLPEGTISRPVKTEFGWHLIKVTNIIYSDEKETGEQVF